MEKSLNTGENLSAKELTKAIEEATDFAENQANQANQVNQDNLRTNRAIFGAKVVEAQSNGMITGLQDETVRGLGRTAQFVENVEAEKRVIASDDEIRRAVAIENGYAKAGNLTPGENVIGGESEIEIKERLESDRKTAEIQSGEGLSKDERWMHEISAKSGRKLVEEVQDNVAEITKKPDFNPAALEKSRFRWMLNAMRSDEGYNFGERN